MKEAFFSKNSLTLLPGHLSLIWDYLLEHHFNSLLHLSIEKNSHYVLRFGKLALEFAPQNQNEDKSKIASEKLKQTFTHFKISKQVL